MPTRTAGNNVLALDKNGRTKYGWDDDEGVNKVALMAKNPDTGLWEDMAPPLTKTDSINNEFESLISALTKQVKLLNMYMALLTDTEISKDDIED